MIPFVSFLIHEMGKFEVNDMILDFCFILVCVDTFLENPHTLFLSTIDPYHPHISSNVHMAY